MSEGFRRWDRWVYGTATLAVFIIFVNWENGIVTLPLFLGVVGALSAIPIVHFLLERRGLRVGVRDK